MDMAFGTSAYSREAGNIAELPIVNMYAERSPVEGRVILQSRRGLEVHATVGDGPIRGLFQRDGIMSGSLVAVSDDHVFIGSTDMGAITGSGAVSFAGDEEELAIVAGSNMLATNGTIMWGLAFPGTPFVSGAGFIKTVDLAGYNLALESNSGRVWFRLWGSSVFDDLDWFTAENEPDRLLDMLAIDDYLVLLGSETIEHWVKTGDAELPFVPVSGRVFSKGIKATGCCAPFDNGFAWVSKDHIVYRSGNVPMRISDSGIEERIEASAWCSVDVYFYEGHEFLRVRGDTFTLQYDAQTGQWSEQESYGRANFAGRCAAGAFFGDDTSGTVWTFTDGYTDDGGILERRFRGGLILDGPGTIDCVRLSVNPGQTPNLSGDYSDPVVEMRASRDAGQTWGAWRPAQLGAQGKYRQRTETRRWGLFDDPGALFEFRCSDPVPFRVSRVMINPANGGRSR